MTKTVSSDGLKCMGLLLFLPVLLLGCAEPAKQQPNFVFILVDDLGWADLGCYGSTFYETPNLDRLASSAVRFTDAYAACPVCSPTRAAIMTGKYPTRVNITDWIPGRAPKDRKLIGPVDRNELALEEVTIAERLGQAGYRTFFAGKWHLGGAGYYPENQGFDINLGGHEKGSPPGGYYSPYKNPKLADGPGGEYLTDRLTAESIRFLEENQDQPFFLYLSFYTVHTPIQACKRHLPKFQAKASKALPPTDVPRFRQEHDGWTKQIQDRPDYASMVFAMDENVGRLLTRIQELGLSERTTVIFTSDNGGLSTLPSERSPTCNLPLRAGKGWCYEGGIRVPLIIRAPGLTEAGSTSTAPVISTDFYPTILDLAGLPLQPEQHRDGLSLAQLMRGEPLEREALYWHYPHYHGSAWTPGAAIRAGNWKLIEFYDKEKVELYNLKNDTGERSDLATDEPEVAHRLLEQLHRWQQETGAQMPVPNPVKD